MYYNDVMSKEDSLLSLSHPTPADQEMMIRLDKETESRARILANAARLPREVVIRVLIHQGLPMFTPALAKALREERIRFMATPEFTSKFKKKRRFLRLP